MVESGASNAIAASSAAFTLLRAMAVVLYSLAKASFGMLGKVSAFRVRWTYRWIRDAAEALPEPEVRGDIKEMEFDEMWHFIGSKKQALAHQSAGSWHRANHGLGYRPS